MSKSLSKGFTLIELLVVIAIIGILSSVVLASLNSARNKGADAAVKASMANARAQAELYYDGQGNYTLVCTAAGGINSILIGAAKNSNSTGGTLSNNALASVTSAVCNDTGGTSWAAEMPFKTTSGVTNYCVDSTGKATTTIQFITATTYACPP